jgi:hypothetical protein
MSTDLDKLGQTLVKASGGSLTGHSVAFGELTVTGPRPGCCKP